MPLYRIGSFFSLSSRSFCSTSSLSSTLERFASKTGASLSISSLAAFHNDLSGLGNFLKEELLIRFAQRQAILRVLPKANTYVEDLALNYEESFERLLESKVVTDSGICSEFLALMAELKVKHHSGTIKLLKAMKTLLNDGALSAHQVDRLLDTFFASRIATNMLISHFLYLYKQIEKQDSLHFDMHGTPLSPIGYSLSKKGSNSRGESDDGGISWTPHGVIHPACSAVDICRIAICDLNHLCQTHYNKSVKVKLRHESVCTMSLVPRFLYYAVMELLKNSLHATYENYGHLDNSPTIYVDVCGHSESGRGDRGSVCIRVLDHGGGFVEEEGSPMDYFYSKFTSINDHFKDANAVDEVLDEVPKHLFTLDAEAPLGGHGCGLPLARLYCRYLGGSLELFSVPSVGTVAYIFFPETAAGLDEGALVGGTETCLLRKHIFEETQSSLL